MVPGCLGQKHVEKGIRFDGNLGCGTWALTSNSEYLRALQSTLISALLGASHSSQQGSRGNDSCSHTGVQYDVQMLLKVDMDDCLRDPFATSSQRQWDRKEEIPKP